MDANQFATIKAIVAECYSIHMNGKDCTEEVNYMSAAEVMQDYKRMKQDARSWFPEYKAVFRKHGIFV